MFQRPKLLSNTVHGFSGSEHLHIDGTTTIENLFAILETALKSSYQLEVSYDPYYGFPQLVHVDWSREIIDDECFYDVKTFKSR